MDRAFIICDVLTKNVKRVYDNKDENPDSYDTYLSFNDYVYVKFEDFTFYPKYVLYYTQPDRNTSKFYKSSYFRRM